MEDSIRDGLELSFLTKTVVKWLTWETCIEDRDGGDDTERKRKRKKCFLERISSKGEESCSGHEDVDVEKKEDEREKNTRFQEGYRSHLNETHTLPPPSLPDMRVMITVSVYPLKKKEEEEEMEGWEGWEEDASSIVYPVDSK